MYLADFVYKFARIDIFRKKVKQDICGQNGTFTVTNLYHLAFYSID